MKTARRAGYTFARCCVYLRFLSPLVRPPVVPPRRASSPPPPITNRLFTFSDVSTSSYFLEYRDGSIDVFRARLFGAECVSFSLLFYTFFFFFVISLTLSAATPRIVSRHTRRGINRARQMCSRCIFSPARGVSPLRTIRAFRIPR